MPSFELSTIHRSLSTALLLFTGISGAWGLVSYGRGRGVSPSYWGILACLELLALGQGLVGGVMLLAGEQPARLVHILYGIVSVVTLPGAYAFTRGRDDRQMTLNYGLICLFLLGVSLRAASTGL
ncbi:MAG: hypothetical protein ACRDG5_01970 [Anaerolineales bacterium]